MRNVGVYYDDKQREKWWAWLVMIGVNLIFMVGGVAQIGFDRPIGDDPMSDVGLIIAEVVLLLLTVMVLSGNLQTYINSEGVFIKYSPYHFNDKFYDWNNINTVYVRKYKPVPEYGGRGIRLSRFSFTGQGVIFSRSIAYTVSGRTGLQIELKSGKSVLIGTQQPDELKKVLVKLGKIA